MNHKMTIVFGLLAAGIVSTAWMSAGAQDATPIAPEATVMPEGAVFIAPGHCTVSPDELLVVVDNYAVFNLSSGQKLYEVTGDIPNYSPDGRYMAVGGKVYIAQTGEVVLDIAPYGGWGHWGDSEIHPSLFFTGKAVFDFSSGEPQLYLFDEQATHIYTGFNGDFIVHYAAGELADDSGLGNVERRDNREWFVKAYDEQTLDLIFDTQTFGVVGSQPSFSSDETRVALSGVGVFAYPTMELLYPLPVGTHKAYFGADDSLLVVWNEDYSDTPKTYHVINAQTGVVLQAFPLNLMQSRIMGGLYPLSLDMTQIAIPIVNEAATDYLEFFVGWSLFDIRTGELLQTITEFEDPTDKFNPIDRILRPYPPEEPYIINGRTLVRNTVVDVETNETVWEMPGVRLRQLTDSYVVSQNPCTVWELP